jgi:glycine cleavage system H protein
LPFAGKVLEVNQDLVNNPELINQFPYNQGWIARLEIADQADLNDTLDQDQYNSYLQQKS